MIKIELLPTDRWQELSEIFDREFDSALPTTGRANIIAALDDAGKIKGFLVAEMLIRVGLIHIGEGESPMLAKKLIKYVESNIPRGCSVVTFASEPRFESLIKKFGCREVEGKIFRRDF